MTCDCEAPRAFSSEVRTARKLHRCVECGADIRPGERYQYVSGIWYDGPADFKSCLGCCQLRHFVESHAKYCVAYGHLYAEFTDRYAVYSIAHTPCETTEDAAALGKALGHLYRLGMDHGWSLGPIAGSIPARELPF